MKKLGFLDRIFGSKNNFEKLEEMIRSGAKEINLDSDIVLSGKEKSKFAGGINIDRDGLIINGNGHSIDARGKVKIFKITGDNVVLKDITFKNAFASYDGGAVLSNSKSLHCINCNFENNYSLKRGGAIDNSGILTLEDCFFFNNYAKYHGKVILNLNQLIMINCNLNNNAVSKEFTGAILGAYAIYQDNGDASLTIVNSKISAVTDLILIKDGFCTIKSSNFQVLSKAMFSNSILNEGELTIFKSIFLENVTLFNKNLLTIEKERGIENIITQDDEAKPIAYIDENISSDYKGFTYLEELITSGLDEVCLDCDISISKIEQNFYEGGIELEMDNITIDGCNHSIDAGSLSRIFIITGSNITLKNIRFKNGKHFANHFMEMSGGGAIYAMQGSNVRIENCQFDGNYSRQYGGAIFNKSKNLSLVSSDFSLNRSEINADGVFNDVGACLECIECNFGENDVGERVAIKGSSIYNKGFLTLRKTNFNDNNSYSSVVHNSHGKLDSFECNFERNHSFHGDGSIIDNSDGELSLDNCIFNDNSSGAIINFRGSVNCNACTFINNRKKDRGSAVMNLFGESMSFEKCIFKANYCDDKGGAVSSRRGVIIFDGCSFQDNIAVSKGGAVYIEDNSVLTFNDCKFISNSVVNGAGGTIYNDEGASLNLISCVLSNSHSNTGGAIYNNSGAYLKVGTSIFQNNTSEGRTRQGGGAINNFGFLTCEKCSFDGNSSAEDKYANNTGGGAIMNSGSLTCDDCSFRGNSSKSTNKLKRNCGGGAIKNMESSIFRSCAFQDNSSNDAGGAIDNVGSLTCNVCSFENNSSQEYGGDAILNNGKFTLDECSFASSDEVIDRCDLI